MVHRISWRGYLSSAAFCAALGVTLISGCDRKSKSLQQAQTNATDPATSPATQSATSRPASVLMIDSATLQFPAARIVLSQTNGGMSAVLYSDDPPSAINSNYTGNSYYFDMKLDGTEPSDIARAVWTYKSTAGRSRDDSPNGIFLNGSHGQLQPIDVTIKLDRRNDLMTARISGTFILFDARAGSAAPQTVSVKGEVEAEPTEK